jgi:hypothetical protein
MDINLEQYLIAIKAKLSSSQIISFIEIIDERILLNCGYFRCRCILINSDFLEIAESFTLRETQLLTLDYRYQWMDSSKKVLRKRWDSVKHFPHLSNFPHHIHIGSETNVEPGQSRNILEFIDFMECEFS